MATNLSKNSASANANLSKNVATPRRILKAGSAWEYDQPGITYDGPNDANTGLPIFYESVGVAITAQSNLTKHAA